MSSHHEDTAWFEELYADAAAGRREVPWDRGGPNPFLEQWVREVDLDGAGRRALVIGTALGDDAELLAARGFAVTGFDVSPTAIEGARRRFPGSSVEYRVADLLDLPGEWREAFDLVAECITVQALPVSLRTQAVDAIASTVAVGGTLVVISGRHFGDGPRDGPPWPLTRGELDRFERTLEPVEVGEAAIGAERRWRGVYIRPGAERGQRRQAVSAATASAAGGSARISPRTRRAASA